VVRNRIKEHIKVRARDIVPHELNYRTHSDAQRKALGKLYEEIGFARSLLAYRLPDGRLKLIDGHLRQSMSPDEEVDVEVLDVNDQEARALLLAIDPLAQLAGCDQEILGQLHELTRKDSEAVQALWQAIEEEEKKAKRPVKERPTSTLPEQYMVLIECETEQEQVAMFRRFKKEGIRCQLKTL
jgi:hypothetical protein